MLDTGAVEAFGAIVGTVGTAGAGDPGIIFFSFGSDGFGVGAGSPGGGSGGGDLRSYRQPFL